MSACPPGWLEVTLGQVAEVRTEVVTPKSDDSRAYIALEDMAQGEPVLLTTGRASAAISNKFVFRAGDVLVGKLRPNLRKAVRPPFGGVCSTDILAVTPKDEVDGAYLLQLVHGTAFRNHAVGTAAGTKMPRTSWKALAAFHFFLPPAPEQRTLAATLQAVDDVIASGEAVVEQLERVRRELTDELLHRGTPPARHAVRESEIGLVPADWDLVRLGDMIEEGPTNGLYRPQQDYGSGIPIVRIDAFGNGDVVDVAQLKRVRISEKDARPYLIRPSDLVINRVNSMSHLAKVGFIDHVSEATVFESNMMRLRVDAGRCLPKFAFLVLASPLARSQLLSHAKRAIAQASINQQDVKGVLVPLPPLAEQQVIVDAVGSVTDRIEKERAVLAERRRLKAALADELLTGKVRVSAQDVA